MGLFRWWKGLWGRQGFERGGLATEARYVVVDPQQGDEFEGVLQFVHLVGDERRSAPQGFQPLHGGRVPDSLFQGEQTGDIHQGRHALDLQVQAVFMLAASLHGHGSEEADRRPVLDEHIGQEAQEDWIVRDQPAKVLPEFPGQGQVTMQGPEVEENLGHENGLRRRC